ncbi:MAG TPA: pitrilysin family protein [Acidobacteriota bacterium]
MRILPLFLLATLLEAATLPGVTSRKLSNGLEVIVVENHSVPLVTLEIAVKSGGFVESPEFAGLSHLYEHMFFKGNRVIPSQEKYLERLRELGATFNGTTSTELVNYYITLPSQNLREGAAFMRDALLYPLFQQKELERERVVVLGEFDRGEGNPFFHLAREVDRKLWYQYFSRKQPIGDRDVITTATREKMVTLKERYYLPNNSAIILAGDLNPSEAFALAEETLGSWARGADPHKLYPVPEHPPLTQSSLLAVAYPVRAVQVQMSWHGPGMVKDTPSTFAADVLSFIVDQPTSKFYKALVDSGLFDRVGLAYFSQVHTGPIQVSGTTSADRVDKALAALRSELQHLTDADYYTDEELAFAKNQLEFSEIYDRERTSGFAHTISFWWATGGLNYFENYLDNLRKVSRGDINTYVRRYVTGKPNVTGVLISEQDLPKAQLLKQAEVVRPKKGSSATALASEKQERDTELFDVDGLRVLLRRNPASEVVTAKAFLDGGLAFSGKDRAGVELLMLQVAARQSRQYPKDVMARELSRLGSSLSGDSFADFSVFTLKSIQRNFTQSMPLFMDALVRPSFTRDEVGLAVQRRKTAIAEQEENPDSRLDRLSLENSYGNHPFAADILGSPEKISAVTEADLQALHNSTLSRSRLLLVVVGNTTRAELEKLIRPAIADLPKGEFRRPVVPDIPNRENATLRKEQRDLPTVYVEGLFAAPNPQHADFAPMYIAVRALSNRLFEEVRTKRNLSYAANASLRRRSANIGQLYVSTPKPNEAVTVIFDQVRWFQNNLLSERDVQNTVNEARTSLLQRLQASEDQANLLGEFELVGGGWKRLEAFLDAIGQVKPEQIRSVMQRYVKNIDFAVLGKLQGVDEKLLTGF